MMAKLSGPHGWGWEQVAHRTTILAPLQPPVWTETAWLEGEIISSRISRVSQKDSESYSPLISFHFIIVCLP